ncbi:MAG: hypothetical protein SWH78_07595 [Thermodesulfobacteriota bacterium]|nr:hypothetical protein [Thermodesulfobacteriota bacterium]
MKQTTGKNYSTASFQHNQHLPTVVATILMGIFSSLVAAYIASMGVKGLWFYLCGAAALGSYVIGLTALSSLVGQLKSCRIEVDHLKQYEEQGVGLLSRLDKLTAELRAKEGEILDLKVEVGCINHVKKRIHTCETEKRTSAETIKGLLRNLDELREYSKIKERQVAEYQVSQEKTAVLGFANFIKNMHRAEFAELIERNFPDSSELKILTSRGLTLFGDQREPFYSLFRGIGKNELSLRKKQVKIIVFNPILNLERTRRIMEIPNPKASEPVIRSHYETVEEIFKLCDYCDLEVRLSHQTASWRIIAFENEMMVSSYRSVSKLPILVFRREREGLFDGFSYYFEKVFELSEAVDSLDNYREIVSRWEKKFGDAPKEFVMKLCGELSTI